MDRKALLINFVVTFVAAFLAISLFAALHKPPRMMDHGHMPPPPPAMNQPQLPPPGQGQPPQEGQGPAPMQGPAAGPEQHRPGQGEHQPPMPPKK